MTYKVGDRVKVREDAKSTSMLAFASDMNGYKGTIQTVSSVMSPSSWISLSGNLWTWDPNWLELIDNKKTMNIKEKFVLAITPEPNKSFRKTGITNGDDLLTFDGQAVFLSWLLKQNADAFKKEVVDDMLAEQEKE